MLAVWQMSFKAVRPRKSQISSTNIQNRAEIVPETSRSGSEQHSNPCAKKMQDNCIDIEVAAPSLDAEIESRGDPGEARMYHIDLAFDDAATSPQSLLATVKNTINRISRKFTGGRDVETFQIPLADDNGGSSDVVEGEDGNATRAALEATLQIAGYLLTQCQAAPHGHPAAPFDAEKENVEVIIQWQR